MTLLLIVAGRQVYTKGRPPWFDKRGKLINKPYLVGVCGGSASGKTTVAETIVDELNMDWVNMLSMDSFYKVRNIYFFNFCKIFFDHLFNCKKTQELSTEDKERAARNEYNFDSPNAFDFELLLKTFIRLQEGKASEVRFFCYFF